MPDIITRVQAKAEGLRHYYTGPCILGHVSERLTSDGRCLTCARETNRRRRRAAGVPVRNFHASDEERREARRDSTRRYRANNPEKAREVNRRSDEKRRSTPEGRAKQKETARRSYVKHREAKCKAVRRHYEKHAPSISIRNKARWRETRAPLAKATAYAIDAIYTTPEAREKFALYLTYMASVNTTMRDVCRRSTPVDHFLADFEDYTYPLIKSLSPTIAVDNPKDNHDHD
jgi:hypothetical protein